MSPSLAPARLPAGFELAAGRPKSYPALYEIRLQESHDRTCTASAESESVLAPHSCDGVYHLRGHAVEVEYRGTFCGPGGRSSSEGPLSPALLPPGYLRHREGSARLWVRQDAAEFAAGLIREAGSLYQGAARFPDARPLRGRDLAYSLPAPAGGRWMVRRLRHGGVLSSVTRGLFLRWAGNRAHNELIIACELARRGIPTPVVVAAAVYPIGPFYRGEVAREFVEARGDLAGCLFDRGIASAADRTAMMGAAGNLVGNLHKAGLDHPDLNLRNILVVSPPGTNLPEAWILDLEKCRLAGELPGRVREAMLARLRRSISRFEAASGQALAPSDWAVFMGAYRKAADV